VAALSATPPEIPVTIEEEVTMNEMNELYAPDLEPLGMAQMATDSTELALADLVERADEARLALADSLLSGNPIWVSLSKLAEDAHNTLCDYQLMRALEKSK
jgi:hypothetical protein